MEDNRKEIVSSTVNIAANKISMIGALLLGLDTHITDLKAEEYEALGFILSDISSDLHKWNVNNRD